VNRHLLREIARQLGESGGAGLVAVLMVLVATVLAGTLLAVRAWIVAELLSSDREATITVTVESPGTATALRGELTSRFPGIAATVMAPAAVRAELASWFPHIAGALSAVSSDSYPTLLVVHVARADEESLTAWLSQRPGVQLAVGSRFWREPLQRVLAGALAGGLALTITLLTGCGIVVLLVVRLMVLGHADEIEIMRLIGARERDIRVPYLVSGATLAGLGSGIGALMLLILSRVPAFGLPLFPLPMETLLVLAATGPLVGLAGALLGLAALPREP
jgi:cell division transport system permease protein